MQPIVPLTATTTATATTAIAVVPAVPHAVSVGGGKPLPREPLHINQSIDLEEEIGPSDPRWVDFDASRGQRTVTLERMALKMGLSLRTGQLRARASLHALLFGPIGCGKSSELKRFAETLTQTGKPHSNQLLPVVLNVRGKMDLDNLRYVDVLMALANALVAQPEVAALKLPDSAIAPLHKWFFERVTEDAQLNELTGELRAEAQGGFSFLGLVRFLARFSAVAKHSSTSKDVVRKVTQNNFSEFAEAFNQLVLGAEAALQHAGIAQRLLFIVDGTDKITSDADAQRLFSTETEQLLLVTALVIYTAPIAYKYGGASHSKLDTELILSIIKIHEPNGSRIPAAFEALREMLRRRIDTRVFESPDLMDVLIEASGGHPRELLKILCMACTTESTEILTARIIEEALDKHAGEFRYWLHDDHYKALAHNDIHPGDPGGTDATVHLLLSRLALFHYNDGSWRASNPVLRRLDAYKKAKAALIAAGLQTPSAPALLLPAA